MTAYVIAAYDIDDHTAYQDYVPGVVPLLHRHGGEILVADFDSRVLEGDGHSVHVILKFSSEESARAWYDDPDYQGVKKIRQDSCGNTSLVLAREFLPAED